MIRSRTFICTVAAGAFLAGGFPLQAQNEETNRFHRPLGWAQFDLVTFRESGMPVIPLMEGWHHNPDRSRTISFGYINLNTDQELDIPLGPDNFIEPGQFDGMQPTHFTTGGDRGEQRYWSAFTVTTPPGYEGDVVWTLRINGDVFRIPGRARDGAYMIEPFEAISSSPVAPSIKFDEAGPEGRGRSAVVAGPVAATVGRPLPLNLWVDLLGRERSLVWWYHHQGPGEVTFAQAQGEVRANGAAPVQVTNTATFSQPGEYILRVKLLESTGALVQACCWTTGYLKVTVTP